MSFDNTGRKQKVKAFILGITSLEAIVFDVSETETHKSTAKVTDHPVEEGANIADHVVVQSDTLDLTAWVSNTPIVSEAEAVLLDPARAEAAYEALRALKEGAISCEVFTTLRQYENMIITSLSVPRNAATGDAISVTLSLQEIRTATSATIAAPTPKVARGNVSADMGKKATTNASEAVDANSKTLALQGKEAFISYLDKLNQ